MYRCKVIKEDFHTGERGRRCRIIYRYSPLEVGGLYTHLGKGFKGCYRVLECVEENDE